MTADQHVDGGEATGRRAHDLSAVVCWCGSTHSWEKAKR